MYVPFIQHIQYIHTKTTSYLCVGKKKRCSIVYHSNTRPGQICLKNDFPGVKLTKSSASGTVKKIDLGTF